MNRRARKMVKEYIQSADIACGPKVFLTKIELGYRRATVRHADQDYEALLPRRLPELPFEYWPELPA